MPSGWQLSGETNPVGDVDGDGYFDVSCGAEVMATRRRTQCVYFGGPSRTTPRRQCLDLFSGGSNNDSSYSDGADIDQDGYSDVILAVASSSSLTIAVYAGSSAGLTPTPRFTIPLPGSASQWALVRAQDFNGDSRPDLFFSTRYDGAWYFQNSAGGFSVTPTRSFPSLPVYYFADLVDQHGVFGRLTRVQVAEGQRDVLRFPG